MANLLKATKDKAQAGKVRRTLNKNFGSTVQASNRSSSVEAEEDITLVDCAALTKAEKRTISTIEKLVTEPAIETQS
jgi:hypothetical protein